MIKMRTKDGLWIIEDGGKNIIFDTSYDAWVYVFLCKEIRPKAPLVQRSLYPVRSLNPVPERRLKNVVFQ